MRPLNEPLSQFEPDALPAYTNEREALATLYEMEADGKDPIPDDVRDEDELPVAAAADAEEHDAAYTCNPRVTHGATAVAVTPEQDGLDELDSQERQALLQQ